MKLISPAVKKRFEGFKTQFHKEYANSTEEEKRLIIFDQNLKEMYQRTKVQDENVGEFEVWIAKTTSELL